MAIHWAWNRNDQPRSIIEAHVPMLTLHPELQKQAVGLFAEVEQPQIQGTSRTIFVDAGYTTRVGKRPFGE